MSSLDSLRELTGEFRPPAYDDLVAVSRTRRQRSVMTAAATGVAAVVVVIVGTLAVTRPGDDAPQPAGPTTPTPTSDLSSPPPPVQADGSIYFVADHRGGDALTDPLSFEQAEFHRKPWDIYLSRRGEPIRRVVRTEAGESCLQVSPDGNRLAYLEGSTIVVVPLDAAGDPGAPQVRAEPPTPPTGCPQWAPDGRSVGYVALLGDPETPLYSTRPGEVHAVSLDGDDRVIASFDTQIWHTPDFAWSPDSDAVVYTTESGLWRVSRGGEEPELLWAPAPGDASQELPMAFDRPSSPTWSRAGEIAFVVYTSTPDEANNPYGTGTDTYTIHLVDPRTDRVAKLESFARIIADGQGAQWSPDGSRLAFIGPDGQIRVHDRATGRTTILTPRPRPRATFYEVGWAPDGEQLIAVQYAEKLGYALDSIPIDGSPSELRTPWTWALDWVGVDGVTWGSR